MNPTPLTAKAPRGSRRSNSMEKALSTSHSGYGLYAFPSELGWMAIAWGSRGAYQFAFHHPSAAQALAALSVFEAVPQWTESQLPSGLKRAIKLLQQYAAGKKVDLSTIPVDSGPVTPFQNRVIAGCQSIPWGETLTYQQLAEIAGSSGAARAVGNVMRTNRLPLIIPCHRVVGAAGSLGGYSAPTGLTLKRRLLKLEGVEL